MWLLPSPNHQTHQPPTLNIPRPAIRPGNFVHDTATRHEHDTNTNLTRHEKIIKTRQKTWHDTDKKMNTTWRHEYLKIAWIVRKMCQFLKNTKTRIDKGKNTCHDTRKTRTRHGDTNCQVYLRSLINPKKTLKTLLPLYPATLSPYSTKQPSHQQLNPLKLS